MVWLERDFVLERDHLHLKMSKWDLSLCWSPTWITLGTTRREVKYFCRGRDVCRDELTCWRCSVILASTLTRVAVCNSDVWIYLGIAYSFFLFSSRWFSFMDWEIQGRYHYFSNSNKVGLCNLPERSKVSYLWTLRLYKRRWLVVLYFLQSSKKTQSFHFWKPSRISPHHLEFVIFQLLFLEHT